MKLQQINQEAIQQAALFEAQPFGAVKLFWISLDFWGGFIHTQMLKS